MKQIKYYISFLFLFSTLLSCIENDIPYPYRPVEIKSIEAKGTIQPADIDVKAQQVTLWFADTIDLANVQLTKLDLSNDPAIIPNSEWCIVPDSFPTKSFDLSVDVDTNYSTQVNLLANRRMQFDTYQTYVWEVIAKQPINRIVEVDGQVGEAVIDEENRVIMTYVVKTKDISNIKINNLHIGAPNSIQTPDFTTVHDFKYSQKFVVTTHGRSEEWTLKIVLASASTTTKSVFPWAKFAYVTGERVVGDDAEAGFKYRVVGEQEWNVALATEIKEGSFTAKLTNLIPSTSYQVKAFSGEESGKTINFTTNEISPIPNIDLSTWTMDGKCWYPNGDHANSFWATGNEGLTGAPVNRESNTLPLYRGERRTGARLTTVEAPIVKLAAGNVFIGSYKTNITNPKESAKFGRAYTSRPISFSGVYKYSPRPIPESMNAPNGEKMDLCHIYIWLKDATGKELAYGELSSDVEVSEYTPFSIKLNYRDSITQPAQIAIVASSSKYGADFIGGEGSELAVDEFELHFE